MEFTRTCGASCVDNHRVNWMRPAFDDPYAELKKNSNAQAKNLNICT